MSNEILLVDGNYLCHYVFHGIGGLQTIAGNPTSIVYGMLMQIRNFANKFKTKKMVFCWDSEYSVRKEMCSTYKGNRHTQERTVEEQAAMSAFYEQVNKLRQWYLPELGFPNFQYDGFEADDLLAWYSDRLKKNTIIITADADLFQCLSKKTIIYNPHKKAIMTQGIFRDEFNISPTMWPLVKAIAGCSSDNVKGIAGVGEKTAIRYLNGELNPASSKCKAIVYGKNIIDFNLQMVSLPHAKFIEKMMWARNSPRTKKMKYIFRLNLEAYKRIAKEIEAESLLKADVLADWKHIAQQY